MSKQYLDDMTIEEALKYNVQGLKLVTGNGHVYACVMPEHADQAESMRVAYDAMDEEKK